MIKKFIESVQRAAGVPVPARPAPAASPDRVSDHAFRFPQDLAVTPTPLRRVMIVGSCMVSAWPEAFKASLYPCPCDFFLFNNASQLPASPPQPVENYDFQIVQIPLRSVLPDHKYFNLPDLAAYEALLEDAKQSLAQNLAAAMRWNVDHGLLTFVTNFMLPQQNPMGRLMPRYDLRNFVHFVEKLNEAMAQELAKYSNAYMVDVDQIVSTHGRKLIQDDVISHFSHGATMSNGDFERDQERLEPLKKLSEIYPARIHDISRFIWGDIVAMYRTVRQLDMVKLVVLDIDDTLWRGVAAEKTEFSDDAVAGWPLGLADALHYLKRRGVLLALCSKNDEGRISEIWPKIMGVHLKLSDFATRKINWRPKAENFREILEDTNLLPRNVLFIDDNPVERAAIKQAFPEVRVLGSNPYLWRRILLWSAETQVAAITAESAARTDMVQAQIERESQRKTLSRGEFLASLGLEMDLFEVTGPEDANFTRAFELLNKTNQFNTSGKRWTRQECSAAFAAGTKFYAFKVKDKFTAYGLVGVLIVKGDDIVQFVMSCRVAGLDVEIAALTGIFAALRKAGHGKVTATLIETELNLLCRDVYERCGFKQEGTQWQRSLDSLPDVPGHITLSNAAR